jgi:hypothetical protein
LLCKSANGGVALFAAEITGNRRFPMSSANLALQKLEALLTQVFQESISAAQALAFKTAELLADASRSTGDLHLSAAQRLALQTEIKQALGRCQYSYGMGFASYRACSGDGQDYWTLEWWFKKNQQLQQAKLEHYQNAQRFLDFRGFDWFRFPEQHRKLYIQGPYVDYICNGAYTITTAYPVLVQGQFVGVIAIDLLVSSLEKILLPALKAIEQTAVIINDQCRVLTSNAVNIRTGTLVSKTQLSTGASTQQQPFHVRLFKAN